MKIKLALLLLTVLTASTTQAATTLFHNAAAFNTAAGKTTTETFSDGALAPDLSFTSNVGSIGGGRFNDRTVLGSAQTTFMFARPATSFGATFDETPGGFGQGLRFTINGVTAGTLDGANAGTFFGFTSTTAFSAVVITSRSATSGSAETYNLDDLSFGASVPEPMSWALMAGGFGLIGGAMRRRPVVVAA